MDFWSAGKQVKNGMRASRTNWLQPGRVRRTLYFHAETNRYRIEYEGEGTFAYYPTKHDMAANDWELVVVSKETKP